MMHPPPNPRCDSTVLKILEAFHHPYYADGRSRIQEEMIQGLQQWIQGLDGEEAENIIQSLTKVILNVKIFAN